MGVNYELKKERERLRMRAAIAQSQEIAPLPEIENQERREKAISSFKFFCETYFPTIFYLKWSTIHLDVIKTIEEVVLNGSLFALAMPRGSGKTTLCQLGVLWAAITGKRKFCVLIASNANRANSLLEDLKVWLETNDLLLADFPEVCYPIRKLERISQRQRGQMYNGERTRIDWKASTLVLPTIKGSISSGSCIMSSGMTGSSIRGLSYATPEGEKRRPDLVLVDDPQDRESAQSEEQTNTRERIIKADLLGMAGAGKKIALLVTTTVIAENDLAERLLDRTRNPEFKGKRYKLLEKLPDNLELWSEYARIRENEFKNDGDGTQSTAFYLDNRAEMDKGAVPTWSERYNYDEISAIQYGMNLYFRDKQAFANEYQNEPSKIEKQNESFDASTVENVLSNYERGNVPAETEFATAFVDVHKNLLYWAICAWNRDFSGVIVDWDTYPKQNRSFFQMANATPTIPSVYKGKTLEASLYASLEHVCNDLNARFNQNGVVLKRILIDANWGEMTELVYQFITDSPLKHITPSHGVFIGASGTPFSEYKTQRGDFVGSHWRQPADLKGRKVRRVLIDVNYWKTFLFDRLNTEKGDASRLVINGRGQNLDLLISHLRSEYRVPTESRNRRVDEWKQRPNRPDNHWLDCLVGCCVGASMEGALLQGQQTTTGKNRVAQTYQKIRAYASRF